MSGIVRVRLHEQVVNHLKDYIVSRSLQPGDQLPTEVDLAEDLGVGRRTVREALRVLEGFGIVESRPRTGTRVKSLTMKPLTDHLRFSLDVQGVTIAEMWDARQALECALLYSAAKNATEDDFLRMGLAIEHAWDLWESGLPISPADLEFHLAVLTATHNRALEGLTSMLHEFFATVLGDFVAGKDAIEDHERILRALRRRDSASAEEVMRQHVMPLDPVALQPEQTNGVHPGMVNA